VSGLAIWLAPLTPTLRRRTLGRLSVRGDVAKRITGFPRIRETVLRQLERAHGRGAVDAVLSDVQEEELQALHAVADPAVRRRIERWAAEDRTRRSPVTGNELVALGLEGPAVGRVLARVRAAVLDGEVANREEAMALAEELARRSKASTGRVASGRGRKRGRRKGAGKSAKRSGAPTGRATGATRKQGEEGKGEKGEKGAKGASEAPGRARRGTKEGGGSAVAGEKAEGEVGATAGPGEEPRHEHGGGGRGGSAPGGGEPGL